MEDLFLTSPLATKNHHYLLFLFLIIFIPIILWFSSIQQTIPTLIKTNIQNQNSISKYDIELQLIALESIMKTYRDAKVFVDENKYYEERIQMIKDDFETNKNTFLLNEDEITQNFKNDLQNLKTEINQNVITEKNNFKRIIETTKSLKSVTKSLILQLQSKISAIKNISDNLKTALNSFVINNITSANGLINLTFLNFFKEIIQLIKTAELMQGNIDAFLSTNLSTLQNKYMSQQKFNTDYNLPLLSQIFYEQLQNQELLKSQEQNYFFEIKKQRLDSKIANLPSKESIETDMKISFDNIFDKKLKANNIDLKTKFVNDFREKGLNTIEMNELLLQAKKDDFDLNLAIKLDQIRNNVNRNNVKNLDMQIKNDEINALYNNTDLITPTMNLVDYETDTKLQTIRNFIDTYQRTEELNLQKEIPYQTKLDHDVVISEKQQQINDISEYKIKDLLRYHTNDTNKDAIISTKWKELQNENLNLSSFDKYSTTITDSNYVPLFNYQQDYKKLNESIDLIQSNGIKNEIMDAIPTLVQTSLKTNFHDYVNSGDKDDSWKNLNIKPIRDILGKKKLKTEAQKIYDDYITTTSFINQYNSMTGSIDKQLITDTYNTNVKEPLTAYQTEKESQITNRQNGITGYINDNYEKNYKKVTSDDLNTIIKDNLQTKTDNYLKSNHYPKETETQYLDKNIASVIKDYLNKSGNKFLSESEKKIQEKINTIQQEFTGPEGNLQKVTNNINKKTNEFTGTFDFIFTDKKNVKDEYGPVYNFIKNTIDPNFEYINENSIKIVDENANYELDKSSKSIQNSLFQFCPPGNYCPENPNKLIIENYEEDTSTPKVNIFSTKNCPTGTYCPNYETYRPIACPAGFYCPKQGLNEPLICPAGSYCPKSETIDLQSSSIKTTINPIPCVNDDNSIYYCPEGSKIPTICPESYYCPTPASKKITCPAGYFCPGNTTEPIQCQAGSYCPVGSSKEEDCPIGHYCSTPKEKELCSPYAFCPPRTTYNKIVEDNMKNGPYVGRIYYSNDNDGFLSNIILSTLPNDFFQKFITIDKNNNNLIQYNESSSTKQELISYLKTSKGIRNFSKFMTDLMQNQGGKLFIATPTEKFSNIFTLLADLSLGNYAGNFMLSLFMVENELPSLTQHYYDFYNGVNLDNLSQIMLSSVGIRAESYGMKAEARKYNIDGQNNRVEKMNTAVMNQKELNTMLEEETQNYYNYLTTEPDTCQVDKDCPVSLFCNDKKKCGAIGKTCEINSDCVTNYCNENKQCALDLIRGNSIITLQVMNESSLKNDIEMLLSSNLFDNTINVRNLKCFKTDENQNSEDNNCQQWRIVLDKDETSNTIIQDGDIIRLISVATPYIFDKPKYLSGCLGNNLTEVKLLSKEESCLSCIKWKINKIMTDTDKTKEIKQTDMITIQTLNDSCKDNSFLSGGRGGLVKILPEIENIPNLNFFYSGVVVNTPDCEEKKCIQWKIDKS